jgi:hypothetical protein
MMAAQRLSSPAIHPATVQNTRNETQNLASLRVTDCRQLQQFLLWKVGAAQAAGTVDADPDGWVLLWERCPVPVVKPALHALYSIQATD